MATAVALGCLCVWIAAILTPRLPKRLLLPPAGFVLWWSLGAAPLGLLLTSPGAKLALGGTLQAGFAIGAFAWLRLRYGTWWLPRHALAGPAFRLGYSLLAAGLHLLLAPFLLAGYLALLLAENLTQSTDRFVSFGAPGLLLEERRYRRDDREVVLVGMMHVGNPAHYREVYASFVKDGTVVLQEGISDVEGRVRVNLSYEPLAEALGLGTQPDLAEVLDELGSEGDTPGGPWPHLRHADVDASEFSPETLAFIEHVAQVLDAADPGVAVRAFGAYLRSLDAGAWLAISHDVLERRNEHVVGELDAALPDYAVVVIPWGALHMPGIQQQLFERGFERVGAERRLAAGYGALLRGAWQGLRALASSAGPRAR